MMRETTYREKIGDNKNKNYCSLTVNRRNAITGPTNIFIEQITTYKIDRLRTLIMEKMYIIDSLKSYQSRKR